MRVPALAACVVLFVPVGATAQSPAVVAVEKKAASLAPQGWTVPRTPDGQPDLKAITPTRA
ncbi:MAG TPA: hypothetical protein VMB25_10110 [Bryobacteraceae bacterium]|nr:hypothetical protein [Bryobacteraceae bacterium]